MEKVRPKESPNRFVFPTFEQEMGELERVQNHFTIHSEDFSTKFIEMANKSKLSTLTDELWAKLENTDSFSGVTKGDWSAVAEHSEIHEDKRDWQDLRNKMEAGTPLDAPVIAKRGESLHLVSGNTRLMVCRALGLQPDVLIVDIGDFS